MPVSLVQKLGFICTFWSMYEGSSVFEIVYYIEGFEICACFIAMPSDWWKYSTTDWKLKALCMAMRILPVNLHNIGKCGNKEKVGVQFWIVWFGEILWCEI